MSAVVVACDLDRTLIYSAAALRLGGDDEQAPAMTVAEVFEGEPVSFWTRDAEEMIGDLVEAAWFVPTTTRTRKQYARVRFPEPGPRYAVTSNGGHILVDGEPCADWTATVHARLGECAPLAEVVEHLRVVAEQPWVRKHRVAEDLFTYLVVHRDLLPPTFVDDLTAWCAARGWTVSLQGRKVYCVPAPLTKSAAVAEVAQRVGADLTFAAGDSLLDADLLVAADRAFRPAHGELHEAGWQTPHLTVTRRAGVAGGEEIVARLLAAVRAQAGTSGARGAAGVPGATVDAVAGS
ncbi:HAD family hydrolase [Cellulomonas algicola]|uniref:HAD family hydrolase n=1 Tax=Cellulomonas algicola TaxID=2071633 RepID=UPI001C3FCA2E|nr:HAD family hydrolase [Cellulomonas algicola]